MLLLIQFALAVFAGLRGWGVLPLGILMFLFIFGMIMGSLGLVTATMIAADFVVTIVLAYMVIMPPEGYEA